MPVVFPADETDLALYCRFDDASSTAVAMTAGTGVQAARYEASDSAIATASLPAGDYTVAVCEGVAASQAATDRVLARGDFRWDGSAEITATVTSRYFARFGTSASGRTVELLGATHPATVYASIARGDGDYFNFSTELFETPGSGALGDLVLAAASTGDALPPKLDVAAYAAFALPAGDYTVVFREGASATDDILAVMPFYADGSAAWETRSDAESSAVNTTLSAGGDVRTELQALSPSVETRDLAVQAVKVHFPANESKVLRGVETVPIAPGETDLRVSLMLAGTRLIPRDARGRVTPATQTDPVVTGAAPVTATKLGVGTEHANLSLACGAGASIGDAVFVECEATNSQGAGPVKFVVRVLVTDPTAAA